MYIQNHDAVNLRHLLAEARTIAVVGHSDDPSRTSYQIAQFLRRAGYKVYAVNPTLTTIDGEPSYPSVAALPEKVDIVNVFRRSEFLGGVVDDAITAGAKTVWAQLAIHDDAAAQKATDAGLNIVMDSCIKVQHMALGVGMR